MLLAVSRVNESVPLFLLEGVKRRLGPLADRKVAVLGLAFKADTDDERDSLAHKLIRLLERELADVAVHDPHVPTPTRRRSRRPSSGADAVVVATNHSRVPRPARRSRRSPSGAGADCLVVDPWNCWGAGQVFAYASELAALGARAMSRVLVTGGAGTIGAAVVQAPAAPTRRTRCASPTSARRRSGCARAARCTPATCACPTQARAAMKGCTHVIHLAAIVGGIANFHRLPYTLTEVNNALYNAVIRAALDVEVERFVYVSSSMVFERAELFPTPEDYLPDCPAAALGLRLLQAHRRGLLPRRPRRARPARTRSAARSTPTARASCPTTSPASPTPCPT